MKGITKTQAITDLAEIFNPEKYPSSIVAGGKFMIHKQECSREETIALATEYFADCFIINGQCKFDPITLVYTGFEVGEG